jgi:hypothetical protein
MLTLDNYKKYSFLGKLGVWIFCAIIASFILMIVRAVPVLFAGSMGYEVAGFWMIGLLMIPAIKTFYRIFIQKEDTEACRENSFSGGLTIGLWYILIFICYHVLFQRSTWYLLGFLLWISCITAHVVCAGTAKRPPNSAKSPSKRFAMGLLFPIVIFIVVSVGFIIALAHAFSQIKG